MLKMSPAGCNAGCQSLAPFTDRTVNHFLVQRGPSAHRYSCTHRPTNELVQMVLFLLDTLAQLFHVRDPVVFVHTLL